LTPQARRLGDRRWRELLNVRDGSGVSTLAPAKSP
jgi:hypothetical protein